jgi:ferredoxin
MHRGGAMVYNKLFTRMDWCPSKDSCTACAVIVPRPENDIMKDLSPEEILKKDNSWKTERQQLILSTCDFKKNKIMCMHCLKEVRINKNNGGTSVILRHPCDINNKRSKRGDLLSVTSNLFEIYEWCPDKNNCKSCIQIVEKGDPEKDGRNMTPEERHREVMRNFDFDHKMIICMHCDKE